MTTPSSAPPFPLGLANSADLEALSIWFKDVPLALKEVWSAPIAVDIHPPLYFLIVHIFRAIGFEFQGAFMSANAIGFVLLSLAAIWLTRLDERSITSNLALHGLVLGSPALLAASEEARHWVLFSGGSLIFSVCFSATLRGSINGGVPSRSLRLLCILLSTFCLLVETSFVLLLISWIVVLMGVGFRHERARSVVAQRLQDVAGSLILWLAIFPHGLANFAKGTDLNQTDASVFARVLPRYNSDLAIWFVRRLGDLWQIGGDKRVTVALAVSSIGFLLALQTFRCAQVRSLNRREIEPQTVSHGFLVGLAGMIYLLLYFLLFSFEYLPTFAVGFKYILPFGVLILVGVWDGLQQFSVGKYCVSLAALTMVYHSLVFAPVTTSQAGVIDRMDSADMLVIVGTSSDLLIFAYAASMNRLPGDIRIHLVGKSDLNSSDWETLCTQEGEEVDKFVFVERPPWGPGARALFPDETATEIERVLGPVEFGEVAQVCSS